MKRKEITIKIILTDDDIKTIIRKNGFDMDCVHDNIEIIGALQNLLHQQLDSLIVDGKAKFRYDEGEDKC